MMYSKFSLNFIFESQNKKKACREMNLLVQSSECWFTQKDELEETHKQKDSENCVCDSPSVKVFQPLFLLTWPGYNSKYFAF